MSNVPNQNGSGLEQQVRNSLIFVYSRSVPVYCRLNLHVCVCICMSSRLALMYKFFRLLALVNCYKKIKTLINFFHFVVCWSGLAGRFAAQFGSEQVRSSSSKEQTEPTRVVQSRYSMNLFELF